MISGVAPHHFMLRITCVDAATVRCLCAAAAASRPCGQGNGPILFTFSPETGLLTEAAKTRHRTVGRQSLRTRIGVKRNWCFNSRVTKIVTACRRCFSPNQNGA